MEAQWLLDHPVCQGLVYKVKPLNDPHEVLHGSNDAHPPAVIQAPQTMILKHQQ
jgi:hypothetical protein